MNAEPSQAEYGFTLIELPFGRLSSSLSLRAEGRTTQQGLTLVELLVVVAIIALLPAMLMPALQRARPLRLPQI